MGYLARFDDPTGERHGGLPTFNYRHAPKGLSTRRQLAARGLTPGRQPIAAQIRWRCGRRFAYLYRDDLAQAKRPATDAQLAALLKAHVAQCICPTCGREYPHYIPRSLGECLACHENGGPMSSYPTADGEYVGYGDAVYLDGGRYAVIEDVSDDEPMVLIADPETGEQEWVWAADCYADPDNDPDYINTAEEDQ